MHVKISEVLHFAADSCLRCNLGDPDGVISVEQAVYSAMYSLDIPRDDWTDTWCGILVGMKNLGRPKFFCQFWYDKVQFHQVQCEKYQWLKFCALLAEEQGV